MLENNIESINVIDQLSLTSRNFNKESDITNNEKVAGIAKIKINLEFAIPSLKITNQKIEVILFAGG